jgi:hypothetical protein
VKARAQDPRDWTRACLFGALVGVVVVALAPPWADDWDGLGFLASVKRFDLDAFAPHPPGYPVYVALLKVGGAIFPDAMGAAKAVLALSASVTVALIAMALGAMIRAPLGTRMLIAVAFLVTPLGLRCATAVGSEGPALAFTCLALYGLATRSPAAIGIGVGLGLGVRQSWAPLLLPLLVLAPRRGSALAYALVSILAWAVPLVAIVGPAHLASLSWTHLAGHATRWGGTALTEPARARFLLRDLFIDGLGVEADGLGGALGVVFLVALLLSLGAWRRARWVGARAVLVMSLPYLVWVSVGQNLRDQPRHVLPLVALMATGLAVAAWVDRRARIACLSLFALVAVRAGLDASARLREPPPGAALVGYVRSLPDVERVLVFGGPSARFFQATELGGHAFSVETMGDVEMMLTRVARPPARILVTSEVADRNASVAAVPLATFCRPARIERKRPCIEAYEVDPARLR